MRNKAEWSASRVAAALASLEDAGYAQPKMARLAGVSQSTVNRWSRGKVQPGYGTVRSLSSAVWRRHPDLARELMEASGYAWAEPADAPEPEPTVSADLLASIRKEFPDDPEAQQYVIDTVERIARGEPPPTEPRAADESPGRRAAS